MPFYSVKNRKDWKVVALCVLAATTFWFLDAMNKEDYTTVIDFPIVVKYDKTKFTSQRNSSVSVEVKGSGWDLLYTKLGLGVQPLTYALKALPTNQQVLARPLIQKLNLKGIEIISYPDSVIVFLKKK